MKARKRKETGDGSGVRTGKRDAPTDGGGQARHIEKLPASGDGGHVGGIGVGVVSTVVGAVERGQRNVEVNVNDREGHQGGVDGPIEVSADFHLCETPQGERVAYRRDAVVAFRKGPYPGQVVVAVGGTTITVSQAPRILGSREQAERWVMR